MPAVPGFVSSTRTSSRLVDSRAVVISHTFVFLAGTEEVLPPILISAVKPDGLAIPNNSPPLLLLLVPSPPEFGLYVDLIAGLGGHMNVGPDDGPRVKLVLMLSWVPNVGFQDGPNTGFGDDTQAVLLLILPSLPQKVVASFDGKLEVEL